MHHVHGAVTRYNFAATTLRGRPVRPESHLYQICELVEKRFSSNLVAATRHVKFRIGNPADSSLLYGSYFGKLKLDLEVWSRSDVE